jgi:exosortase/archaeosortase family protein
LFLFLLCGFVLIDWKMFSKVRHLWVAFVLTVPFVLVVNSFRIAGLFLYAEWNVLRYGRTQAVTATIEAFHSNIGWVIYTVAFAIYLPMVYRWARCSAKIS